MNKTRKIRILGTYEERDGDIVLHPDMLHIHGIKPSFDGKGNVLPLKYDTIRNDDGSLTIK